MFKNKKGQGFGVFGFFFMLMVFSSLFFFFTFGIHYLLYDYAITPTTNIASSMLNATGESITNINNLGTNYLGLTSYYDLLFLVLILSAFIQTTIASIKAKEHGFLSFFGLVTIGNVFLIFVLSYATQIQGWILNEVIFNVILVTANTPVLTFFFNYSMYIAVLWYLWLIAINQVDLLELKQKSTNIFSRNNSNDLTSSDGRFEE